MLDFYFQACWHGHRDTVQYLLDQGVDARKRNNEMLSLNVYHPVIQDFSKHKFVMIILPDFDEVEREQFQRGK